MANEMLKSIHSIQLDMLKVVDEICTKHNIRYYAIGGTCLGAIRHKGFIPWDDDIDIGMPRVDYKRFLEVAEEELDQGFFLQTYKSDENYFYSYAKLRNSNTTFIEESLKNLRLNHGMFIDIFPLDGIGNNKFIGMINAKIIKVYHYILCLKMIPEYRLGNSIGKHVKGLLAWVSKDKINKRIEAASSKRDYDSSKYVVNYFGAYGRREIVPRFIFGEGIDLEFEDIQIKVPKHYDSYMTRIYGNYMELPPPEKRVNIHNATIVDCNTPYTQYIEL